MKMQDVEQARLDAVVGEEASHEPAQTFTGPKDRTELA